MRLIRRLALLLLMVSLMARPSPLTGTPPESTNNPGAASLSLGGQAALPLIKQWEGFVPGVYFATDAEERRGLLSIGFGRTTDFVSGKNLTNTMEITSPLIEEAWLQGQLSRTEGALKREVGDEQWASLSPNQQAALLSLAYNTDKDVVGQLKKSLALKNLKAGNIPRFLEEAFSEERGFVKQDGRTLKGLVDRRAAERELWEGG